MFGVSQELTRVLPQLVHILAEVIRFLVNSDLYGCLRSKAQRKPVFGQDNHSDQRQPNF